MPLWVIIIGMPVLFLIGILMGVIEDWGDTANTAVYTKPKKHEPPPPIIKGPKK